MVRWKKKVKYVKYNGTIETIKVCFRFAEALTDKK